MPCYFFYVTLKYLLDQLLSVIMDMCKWHLGRYHDEYVSVSSLDFAILSAVPEFTWSPWQHSLHVLTRYREYRVRLNFTFWHWPSVDYKNVYDNKLWLTTGKLYFRTILSIYRIVGKYVPVGRTFQYKCYILSYRLNIDIWYIQNSILLIKEVHKQHWKQNTIR